MGNSGCLPGESQLRQSRATQTTVHAGCFSVSIIHRTLAWTTGFLTCAQMLMHAIAHGGCTDTVKESALKVDSGRKNILPHRGIEPASAACRSDALATELHPHPHAGVGTKTAKRPAKVGFRRLWTGDDFPAEITDSVLTAVVPTVFA